MSAELVSASPDENDLADLRERLSFLASGGAGRIVTVIGSGLSVGSVPSTLEMAEKFIERLSPIAQEGLRQRWTGTTESADKYQKSALAVSRQQGDAAVNLVIREAVLAACRGAGEGDKILSTDVEALRRLVREAEWDLTPGHVGFANFYSRLPADIRGPIITTNFDPLIEVALRKAGVQADAFPVVFDDPPSPAVLNNSSAVPVIHIHGYFAEQWSRNSLEQLGATRQNLESVLSSVFSGSTILVLGYGGWEDSFMRVLQRHAHEHVALNAEVVWAAHSQNRATVESHPVLHRLVASPGFQLYVGIDAASLFDAPIGVRTALRRSGIPRGWTALPVVDAKARSARVFSEGATPTWGDAADGQWPLLSASTQLLGAILHQMDGGAGRGVAAIGPLGEGKSTGLRQVAMRVAQRDSDWTVLWREQGAPPLTQHWMEESRRSLGKVIFCIDEADLAAADMAVLAATPFDSETPSLVLAACRDRLWWSIPGPAKDKIQTILFDGMTDSDAASLAGRWQELRLETPRRGQKGGPALSVEEVTKELQVASQRVDRERGGRSTLFGAILEVREGDSLGIRIDEMMENLSQTKVRIGSETTLADVFGIICVLQKYSDSQGSFTHGATRALIADAVNADDSLENVAILQALGKEAAVTFSGKLVYSRHPRIADGVVSWLSRTGRLGLVCQLAGRAGGRMRQAGASREDYVDGYMLGKFINEPVAAAAACQGAIEGARDFLEPRITYMSVMRKFDPEQASKYGVGIVRLLTTARDRKTAIRVYLNELALLELSEGHHLRALGLVGLLLHNGSGMPATREQVGYGLGTLAKAYGFLLRQNREKYEQGAVLLGRIAQDLLGTAHFDRYVSNEVSALGTGQALERSPLRTILHLFALQLDPHVQTVVREFGLPFGPSGRAAQTFRLEGRVDFSEISYLELPR